jgi:glycosyltransferase involved in cell wall biosynthesis
MERKMNILYIWDFDYPWDVRVEKICLSLVEYGYNVHIAARNHKKRIARESSGHLTIHRTKATNSNFINYFISFPFFANPIWLNLINKIICEEKIDLIIVRDLPLSITAIWMANKHKIPCIFDMAENYVAMLNDFWKENKRNWFNYIVRNPKFAKYIENYALKKVDHILVVVKESADRILSKNVPEDHVTIVSNTPSMKILGTEKVYLDDSFSKKLDGRYIGIYTGGIQSIRGIHTVLKAIPFVIKQIPNFLFVVAGDGNMATSLKQMSSTLGVSDYVFWTGWIEHKYIYELIRRSNVGLIPHIASEHVNTTIPNKIFDYMIEGLPIVCSDAPPLKRIVEEKQCGVTFQSENFEMLADAILQAQKFSDFFGNNGRKAILEEYNWENDSINLKKTVEKFLQY